jgi:predicted  nucleic acid-binding Zn-ribbon protein
LYRQARRPLEVSSEASTRTQLAAFRAFRQAQKRAAELTEQLRRTEQEAAHQRRDQEQQAQTLGDLVAAAHAQIAHLEARLREAQAALQAQTAVAAEATTRCEAERQRAASREEQLACALVAERTERAESDRTRGEVFVLALCEARALACAQTEASRCAGMQAGRLEAQQQLAHLTHERDQALKTSASLRHALATEQQRLAEKTDQIARAKEVIREFIDMAKAHPPAELQPSAAALLAKVAVGAFAAWVAPQSGPPSRTQPSAPEPPSRPSLTSTRRYGRLDGGSPR